MVNLSRRIFDLFGQMGKNNHEKSFGILIVGGVSNENYVFMIIGNFNMHACIPFPSMYRKITFAEEEDRKDQG